MPQPPEARPAAAGRVVAVVVTFNRESLLRRLLDVLRGLPELTEVVVVDNASTDGTAALLAELASDAEAPVPVHPLRLPENSGGAGGFHAGLESALRRDADLVWLMDDDGVPEPGCLPALLAEIGTHDFVGPAVVAEERPDTLCFPIRLPGRSAVAQTVAEAEQAAVDGRIEGVVVPFNGVLVTRALVERIGLPRPEFFIWGDDVEFLWRARRDGARVATVVSSRFRHPATDDLGTPMAFGRTTYNHSPSDLKHYCMCRNNVVNLRDYYGPAGVAAFVGKTLWFYAFTRPSAARMLLSVQGMLAGLRGDFRGHRRFLP